MLDENEYKRIWDIYSSCIRNAKRSRKNNNASIDEITMDDLFRPVREEYEKITGFCDIHHYAIIHHEINAFGQECPSCGKPFRTPKAKICAECGYNKEQITEPGHSL